MTDTIESMVKGVFGETVVDTTEAVSSEVITADSMKGISTDDRLLLPVSQNVKLMIKDAKLNVLDSGNMKKIDIFWQVVDGIEVNGENKFKNATFWQRGSYFDNFFVYASAEKKSDFFTSGKFKANFKRLFEACQLDQLDINNPKAAFAGKKVYSTVGQVANQSKNEDGEYVDDGTFSNVAKHFKVCND